VLSPVHKNNYFKVMKKHSLLGKQMEPHVSEQFERNQKTPGADSKCMSVSMGTGCLPQESSPDKASQRPGSLDICPPINTSAKYTLPCFRGLQEGVPFFLYPEQG
jgi:hypothetical protein